MIEIINFPTLAPSNPALYGLSSHTERARFCSFGIGPQEKPTHNTMISAIEGMCHNNPDAIAATVVGPDGELDKASNVTFAELNRKANLLASLLQSHGVGNGDAVCLFLTRSIAMLVAIVASLKVGACYVPQHLGVAPSEQLLRVANATNTKVVLTLDRLASKLPHFDVGVSVIAADKIETSTFPNNITTFTGPSRTILPSDRCYIIFTSGTTGAPKGVQVTHGNIANVVLTHPMDLGLAPGVRIAQTMSISFDMGAWEILGSMSHGATLLIRDRNISAALKHADVIISTPTVLGTLDTAEMNHIKTVAVAGEPCPRSLASRWAEFCTFYNACGPTEVTIINTAKEFNENEEVLSIGSPTPNNTVYVLDPNTREPCEIGEVGEMWGGGLCVSAGYLNNDRLTAERYLPDPFAESKPGQKWRMYRTGDLGRWNDNGELEHLGRVDDQVKAKGFRVELDGIASVIETIPGVEKAVVLNVDNNLVAWTMPNLVDETIVKVAVKARLPYYCVPARVFCSGDLPRTSNGKVDKRVLVDCMRSPLVTVPETVITNSDKKSAAGPLAVLRTPVYVFGASVVLRWLLRVLRTN